MGGFIVDESTGVCIASWLRSEGHDAVSIREIVPRLPNNVRAPKVAAPAGLLADPPADLSSCFVVVTERGLRVTRRGQGSDE
jgi:hypothetical protein